MAGRPTGSKNLPKFTKYLSLGDIEKTVKTIKEMALIKKDPQMLRFLAENIFGKAPQNVDFGVNQDLKVLFDGLFKAAQTSSEDSNQ